MIASDPTLANFGLTLSTKPDADGVVVRYTGIPGNRPASFHNSVALWDTWQPILEGPNQTLPLLVVPITENEQPNTVYLQWAFTGTDYLITFQPGPELTTMCAQLQLSLNLRAMIAPPTSISLEVNALDATSITVLYNTTGGYRPKSYGNWVGVWQGFPGPYFATAPDGWEPVGSDHTEDLLTVSNLRITPQRAYTVIYFMGPQADGVPGSNLGAVLTFLAADGNMPAAPEPAVCLARTRGLESSALPD